MILLYSCRASECVFLCQIIVTQIHQSIGKGIPTDFPNAIENFSLFGQNSAQPIARVGTGRVLLKYSLVIIRSVLQMFGISFLGDTQGREVNITQTQGCVGFHTGHFFSQQTIKHLLCRLPIGQRQVKVSNQGEHFRISRRRLSHLDDS